MPPKWKPGDEVFAASWGYPPPKIDVESVRVKSAGQREARLERMHGGMNYRSRIAHDEGSRSRREALLVLKAATVAELEAARSAVQHAEGKLAEVERVLAAEEK